MKFSIIMPAFNCEKFIKKSIESVVNQSYQDWELIIINDGSTDDTFDICKKYAEDKRIKIYTIENSGPSSARNYGLNKSSGEFVLFIDSDDFFELSALDILNSKIEKKEPEILFFSNYTDICTKDSYRTLYQNKFINKFYISNNDFKYDFCALANNSYIYPVWNKCYSKKILNRTNAKFPEKIKFSEDFVFNLNIYIKANKIMVINKALYHYVSRKEGSITTSFDTTRLNQINFVYNYCKDILNEWNEDFLEFFSNIYILEVSVFINNLFNPGVLLSSSDKREIIFKIITDQRVINNIKNTNTVGIRNYIFRKLFLKKQINLLYFIGWISRIIKIY